MKRTLLTLAIACAAFTFSLAVCAQAQTVTFLAQFAGSQGSATGVVQGTDGNFYGVAGGGAYSFGQVFRMTPAGELSTIYSFCAKPNCPDGKYPNSAPLLASDGNLYGVVQEGGNRSDAGTFYKISLSGDFTPLYAFCSTTPCDDGLSPTGLTLASDGNFYGTTVVGKRYQNGTIFQITPTGQFKVLYTFCSQANCTDGARPNFPPIQGSDGNFYGTTYAGGLRGGGVVYELTPSGTYTVLHNFCGQNENNCDTGGNPATIVQGTNGNLYGTTVYGFSTVFELTPAHQYRVLYTFKGAIHGETPFTALTLANDGNFYGMTQNGGGADDGTIFEITAAGEFRSLYSFASPQGYDPAPGPLFQATNGLLYGATIYGPNPCCYGTIFTLSNGLSPLVETVPVAGKVGNSVLILGNGLTGTTSVTFNGTTAEFTVESDTYIKATVPVGATTGTVSVVTPSGTLNSNPQFVVTK